MKVLDSIFKVVLSFVSILSINTDHFFSSSREVFNGESRISYQKIPSINSLDFTELNTKAILADKPRGATNTLKSLSETRWKADNNWRREMEDMVEPKKKLVSR